MKSPLIRPSSVHGHPSSVVRRGVTLFALLTGAITAQAHDTWLIPDRFVVPIKAIVSLDLTSGMTFPALETSIKPDRIARAGFRLSKRELSLADFTSAQKSLRFQTRLIEPGVAVFWVELKPRSLELTPKQVKEYLAEIDAPEAIKREWAARPTPKRWRETYTKHSKTFVRVGDVNLDISWAGPVGMSLEIVPESDPTLLRAGNDFSVSVLKNGAPLNHFPLTLVPSGGLLPQTLESDAKGRVTFHLPKKGRYLLRGTELRKSTTSEADWESDFTTMTIEVSGV